MAGGEVTGHRLPPDVRSKFGALFELSLFHGEFWHQLIVLMRPLIWLSTVGSMLFAAVLATAAYQIALAFVKNRLRLQNMIHHRD